MKPTGNDVRNETIRAALLALVHDGGLSPQAVVEAARSKRSPLHEQFEWDDSVAGDQYRLAQAGALIRRVKLTIVREDGKSKQISITTTRAFQSRPSMRGEGGYESVEAIMADEGKRMELLASVLRELNAYRRRYEGLFELRDVWVVIDEVSAQLDIAPTQKADDARPSAPAGA